MMENAIMAVMGAAVLTPIVRRLWIRMAILLCQ